MNKSNKSDNIEAIASDIEIPNELYKVESDKAIIMDRTVDTTHYYKNLMNNSSDYTTYDYEETLKSTSSNHLILGAPTPEKIDLAIKQLEQEILTLNNMEPVDYVVNICIKNSYRLAYVYYLKYRYLNIHQHYEQSQEWLEKAISQSKRDNNHDLYMKSLLDQGQLDYEKGRYLTAIKVWMQCLEYAVKLGNDEIAGTIVLNIGKVYFAINHYEIAKQYHQKAWNIAIKTDSQILKAGVCINLAVDCLELQEPSEALKYLLEGEKYIEGLSEYSPLYSELMINLGRTKAQLGLHEEALVILRFLYNFNISQDLKWQRILCELNLGKVYFSNKDYDDAILWFETALSSATTINASHMEMTIHKWLYSAYVEKENYKLALQYYNSYVKTYEKLFKIDEKQSFNLFDEEMRRLLFKSQIVLLSEEFMSPAE